MNWKIPAALTVLYLFWGSTYLGIRYAVEVLPPWLMASTRFLIAGSLLLGFALFRGESLPQRKQDWRIAMLTGVMLLVCANGLVTYSEQWVESNQAALLVASSALWMAWLGSLGQKGESLSRWTWAGLALGYAGVFVLMAEGLNHATAPIKAYLALFISPMAWAAGSIVSRRNPLQCSPVMGAAIQTLTAGVLMGVIGLILGEAPRYRWSAQAGWSVAYLVVAGSLIGYLCYYWLISQVTPALLGTYAYVNPAVAVWLGWWLADEQLSLWQWAGTGVILAGVVLVTLGVRRTKRL